VIELVPLSAELAPAWDALVRGSPDGWVFGLAGWQRLVLGVAEWGLRDLSFAAVEQRRLLGVMPLQLDATGARAASSGFGGSGPIVAGELARPIVSACAARSCVMARSGRAPPARARSPSPSRRSRPPASRAAA
jgi:hypothetical protein